MSVGKNVCNFFRAKIVKVALVFKGMKLKLSYLLLPIILSIVGCEREEERLPLSAYEQELLVALKKDYEKLKADGNPPIFNRSKQIVYSEIFFIVAKNLSAPVPKIV